MLPTNAFYFSAVQFLMPYNYTRKLKFLTKLQSTEIGLCKLFVKNTVDKLATVHECIRVMTIAYI